MRLLLLPVLLVSAALVQGADFTSVTSADFDNAWGGKVPGPGDHVRILPGHTVTINDARELGGTGPSAVTVEGKLVLNGKLTLRNHLLIQNNGSLQAEPGSTLDLGTSELRANGVKSFRLTGQSGRRIHITGSTRSGAIQVQRAAQIEITGVDFTDMAPCSFLVSNAPGAHFIMQNCLWENYSGLSVATDPPLNETVASAATTYAQQFLNTDFRNPSGGTYLTVSGAGPVNIAHCTFSGGSAQIYVLSMPVVFQNNICDEARYVAELPAKDNQVTGNFFDHTSTNPNDPADSVLTNGKTVIQGNYFYVTFNNSHTIEGGANPLTVRSNVIEGYSPPADHIIPNVGDTTVTGNILIGSGTLVTRLMNPSTTDRVSTKRNTVYISSSGAGMIHYCEMTRQNPISAVVSSNIIVDTNPASADRGVWAEPAGADQLTYLDYNAWFNVATHYSGVTMTGKTPGSPGFGGHDIANVNPGFVDPTRMLSKWDTVNGGPGTHDHAVQEMLKLNSAGYNANYAVSNLVTYVQQGFVATNPQLKGAGDPADGSPDIGAMGVQIPVTPPTANAGPDATAYEAHSFSLDGSASTNADTYAWTQLSGKTVTLVNPNTAKPSFTAPRPATKAEAQLTFRLTVTNAGGSNSDDVAIRVRLLGDANGDDIVDSADRRIWLMHYDPTGLNQNTFDMGDFDLNGVIDSADRRVWLENYNPLPLPSN